MKITTFNFLRILSNCAVSNAQLFGFSTPTPVVQIEKQKEINESESFTQLDIY